MRPRREFPHLRSGGFVRADEPHLVHPLDPRAAVPAGNDEPHRSAVVRRQRLAVHADGEEGAGARQRVERKHPARARDGLARVLSFVIESCHANRRCVGQPLEPRNDIRKWDTVPFRDAHQTEVLRIVVPRALDQMCAHRCGRRLQLGKRNRRRLSRARYRDRPPTDSRRQVRRRTGADEDTLRGSDLPVDVEIGEVGEHPGVEARAADQLAEGRFVRAITDERHRAEQLAERASRRAQCLGGQRIDEPPQIRRQGYACQPGAAD